MAHPASPPGVATDEQLSTLCHRLRASDRGALAELFAMERDGLLRYVASIIRDGNAAHDLVQDVFVSLWDRRARLDPGGSLRALLFRMARNCAMNHLRFLRVRRFQPMPYQHAAPQALPDLDAADQARRLRAWIDDLPMRQSEAIELTRFCGLSHQEAAAIMGISPRTLNNHLVRALETLRQRAAEFSAENHGITPHA